MMYNIGDDELLIRINTYDVLRGEERLRIEVCERIAGESHHTFMAFPIGLMGEPEKNFVGFGETETEALRGCLNRIRNVPFKEIIEDSVNRRIACEPEE